MKTKKRIVSRIFVATVLCILLLTAVIPSTIMAASKKLTPYQIDWYYIGNGAQPDQELIEQEMNKYLKDKLNVTVKLHPFDWGTYEQRMQVLLATGEKVDLFFTATWGSNIYQNVRKGVIVDITKMLDKYAPHAKAVLKGGFLEGSAIDGKTYGLPCNKEKASQMGILFNKKMVEQYGFDISKVNSFEDLEPMLKEIKEKEPDSYPLESTVQQNAPSYLNKRNVIFEGGIIALMNNTEKFVSCIDNPDWIALLKTTYKYYKAGYIRKDAATINDSNPDEKSGKLFVVFNQLKPGKDVEFSAVTGVEYIQKEFGRPFTGTDEVSGSMMAISKGSKDPARVLQFYDLFYHDKYLINLMNYGIEGKHYVKKGPNVIDFAPGTENGKKSGWNPGTPWMFGNQLLSYLYTNEDPKKWEKFQKFNDSAEILPSAGFVFDGDSVKNEIAACRNIQKEFDPGLTSGTMDPDVYIPKYREKLKAAGIDRIIAEITKQYKAWKVKKSK